MKSGYGFIKRLNVDKEIFFHITQVQNGGDGGANEGGDNKDAKKVQIGDKVDFSIGQHDDREVASQIYILPKNFPMEFDQILQDPFSRQFVGKFLIHFLIDSNLILLHYRKKSKNSWFKSGLKWVSIQKLWFTTQFLIHLEARFSEYEIVYLNLLLN